MKGLEYYWAISADAEEISKRIETLIDMVFNGLLKK